MNFIELYNTIKETEEFKTQCRHFKAMCQIAKREKNCSIKYDRIKNKFVLCTEFRSGDCSYDTHIETSIGPKFMLDYLVKIFKQ